MSLLVSYSTELQECVDAELAYEWFWTGKIKDKKAFKCPDPNCNADVTCANMDKATDNLKQAPHFRAFHHSPDCALQTQTNSSGTEKESSIETTSSEIDELLLERPSKEKPAEEKEASTAYRKRVTHDIVERKYTPRYFTIRSLVSRFVHLRHTKGLEDHYVKIGEEKISYKELFVGVYQQSFEHLNPDNRIYWGLAYYDRMEKTESYRIRFIENFEVDSKPVRPSLFIPDSQLAVYPSKIVEERIKLFCEMEHPKAFVFIYGKPTLKTSGYINFAVDNLDLFDLKDLSFFDKLKGK